MEKIRTTVRIAGKDYTMSGYDSEDYVRRVALHVDRKIRELSMTTRMSSQDVAVLTAVLNADEMLKAQDENTRLRREMEALQAEIDRLKDKLAESGEE
ncbi:MAG: cell division protein ZapA [Clostridia bacterium]|nr:cell division protein ZapA [Clostridia bacterium]